MRIWNYLIFAMIFSHFAYAENDGFQSAQTHFDQGRMPLESEAIGVYSAKCYARQDLVDSWGVPAVSGVWAMTKRFEDGLRFSMMDNGKSWSLEFYRDVNHFNAVEAQLWNVLSTYALAEFERNSMVLHDRNSRGVIFEHQLRVFNGKLIAALIALGGPSTPIGTQFICEEFEPLK